MKNEAAGAIRNLQRTIAAEADRWPADLKYKAISALLSRQMSLGQAKLLAPVPAVLAMNAFDILEFDVAYKAFASHDHPP